MNVSNIGLRLFAGTGEGPHYDSVKDELFLVDIPNLGRNNHGRIFRKIFNNPTTDFESFDMGSNYTSFVIPTKHDKLLVGLNQSIAEVDWPRDGSTPSHTVMHSVEEGKPTRFNDAKCDPRGRLLAGTMSLEKDPAVVMEYEVGSIYGVDSDRSIRTIDDKYTLSNGLAWTADEQKFFFIDSVMNKVFLYDYDPNNFTAGNRQVFFDMAVHENLQGSVCDGCCIDSNDNLWVALFFGSRVICIDTKTGQVVNEIKLPTKCITSCCFAGPHLNELVVTSSKTGAKETDEEAGSLYRVTNIGVKGVPMVAFNG